MENSYLFLNKTHQRQVKRIKLPSGITRTVLTYLENTQFIVKFYIDGENEHNANKLSKIHDIVIAYSPRVIACDSSAYYNQKLYHLANHFERKLRQLLYLATSDITDEGALKKVTDLELQTLGVLFDNLFTDTEFINKVKSRINCQGEFKGMSRYSKAQIQEQIELIEENSFWKLLFGEGHQSVVERSYYDIWESRNSIMHAHNIGKEAFRKSKELLEEAINELNVKITKQMEKAEKEQENIVKIEKSLLGFSSANEILIRNIQRNLDEMYKANLETSSIHKLAKALTEYDISYGGAREALQQIAKAFAKQTEQFKYVIPEDLMDIGDQLKAKNNDL